MTPDPIFAVMLSPHRSLSATGVRNVVALTAVLAAIPGLVFFLMGAWPVVGFLGLEVVLVYWALSRSLKDKNAFEEITLWADALEWRRVSAKGEEQVLSFNPFFVRFSAARDNEDRVTALTLATREGFYEIGRFLTPDDKARFAAVFAPALSRARG